MECSKCGNDIAIARYNLGYKLCPECGEQAARKLRGGWCVVPMHKSNYMLVTDPEVLKQLNPKRR
jgi:ribosomal protein L37AE/L43A